MKTTFKQYTINETELRNILNEANKDLISKIFHGDVVLQHIAENPECLQHKLVDVLMDCDPYVTLFDISAGFRDLAELFLEHWSCFNLCHNLVQDYERDPSLDFQVVILDDQGDNRVVFDKTQLLRNY